MKPKGYSIKRFKKKLKLIRQERNLFITAHNKRNQVVESSKLTW